MKVIVQRKKVVGKIMTEFGDFQLLDLRVSTTERSVTVSVVDKEGFENYLTFSGKFMIIPDSLPVEIEVKSILSSQEEAKADKTKLFDDGTKEGEFLEVQPDDIIIDLR